jgi:hypothetical protein
LLLKSPENLSEHRELRFSLIPFCHYFYYFTEHLKINGILETAIGSLCSRAVSGLSEAQKHGSASFFMPQASRPILGRERRPASAAGLKNGRFEKVNILRD